jgi:hypothetical protein
MTDKTIQKIIDHYHQPVQGVFMTSQPISANVRFALVWDEEDHHHLHTNSPYRFYLILNHKGEAVGAVLDMTQDLHWYIQPADRRKGFLTRALKEGVLPHLSRFRKSQRITVTRDEIGKENFKASLAVARLCKFRVSGGINNKTICTQNLRKYRVQPLAIRPEGMDFDEMAELRKDMNVVVAKLWQIQSTVQLRLGKSKYSEELLKTVDLLDRYRMVRLEDSLYGFLDK